jgi:hypothetical protein
MQAVYHFLHSLLFFVALTRCMGVGVTRLLSWGLFPFWLLFRGKGHVQTLLRSPRL